VEWGLAGAAGQLIRLHQGVDRRAEGLGHRVHELGESTILSKVAAPIPYLVRRAHRALDQTWPTRWISNRHLV
jgi:hypothetical protein